MNDKKDMDLGVASTIEWCARYAWVDWEWTQHNWEVYVWDQLVAYNYDVEDGYITKYSATGHFPHSFKLDVAFCHESGSYNITKKHV